MMNLRFVVVIFLTSALISGAGVARGQDDPNKPIPISTLALIDAHNHLPRGVTLDLLLERMNKSNVAKTVLMTVYYGAANPRGQGISDEDLVLEFYKKSPERIIPFLGMQRPELGQPARWRQPDETAEKLLAFTESRLRTGTFRGIGEFILWHYAYSLPSGATGNAVKIPADSPLMKRFLDLGSKYRVPVLLHHEIDPESLPVLKRMLDYGRSTTVILAHNCGRPDPATLKALLDEYRNLYCDLGGMTNNNAYGRVSEPSIPGQWFVKNPVEDGTGHIRQHWREFYEAYADRFVGVGPDSAHPEAWENPDNYARTFASFRSMLSDLSPEAAEKIGYKNAQKIFPPPSTY